MRKYDRLMIVSLFLYVLAVLATGYVTKSAALERDKTYKVEINRIYSGISSGSLAAGLDLSGYEYVKGVAYLTQEEVRQEETASAFFEESNTLNAEVRPLFEEGTLAGFLRFDYKESGFDAQLVTVITQVCLGIMELFIISILLYLRYQLIRPFQRMKDLPYELEKGHLKGIVKEEKNRYFGDFVWGLGQLKDRLDVTRSRSLELEKEKKLMLLSLSHDIKTPLNTIKLYGRALEEDIYGDEAQKRHAAQKIGEKVLEIERYVEEIIKNSREDILDIQVKKEEFYLNDLIKKVLDTYRETCEIRMVQLKVEEYENRLLSGDFERTLEVFENIFENALKYGDGQRIEITFYEEDFCQLIRIFSTGTPVTDSEFNHIFESFFRASNSQGSQGNGLGLYICREIMRKMGGEIFAETEQGGMAFVLVFLGTGYF